MRQRRMNSCVATVITYLVAGAAVGAIVLVSEGGMTQLPSDAMSGLLAMAVGIDIAQRSCALAQSGLDGT